MNNTINPSVLVFEAAPQLKSSLFSLLESQQIEVIPITKLKALQELKLRHTPELLIMDLSADPDTKFEAARYILTHDSFAHTKLLLAKPAQLQIPDFIPAERLAGTIASPIFFGELYGRLHELLYEVYLNQVS